MILFIFWGLCCGQVWRVRFGFGLRFSEAELFWFCNLFFFVFQKFYRVSKVSFVEVVVYLSYIWRRKLLIRFSCRLQMFFWKAFLSQFLMLYICTRLECQQMERFLSVGFRRKLFFLSFVRERKCNRGQSVGFSNTFWSWGYVLVRFFLLFLFRKEKRCSRYFWLSWVMCMVRAVILSGLQFRI